MAPPFSVLVIGVGEFGRHYADLLSRLNRRRLPRIPQIERLIVTRTQFESAGRFAETLQQNDDCSVKELVAATASGIEQVRECKDPGPEGPALVHPGGVIWVINFTSSVQVSGFGCQVSATEVDPLGRSRS